MYIINKRDFGWNVIDGNFYLCNDVLDKYYRMNEVAQDIWNVLIENPNSEIINICEKLMEKYECEKEQLEKDISNFIKQLEKIEAIVIE